MQGLQRSAVREHGASERTQAAASEERRRTAALNSELDAARNGLATATKQVEKLRAKLETIGVSGGGGGFEEGRDNDAAQRRQNGRVGEEEGEEQAARAWESSLSSSSSDALVSMQVPMLDPALSRRLSELSSEVLEWRRKEQAAKAELEAREAA